MPLRKTLHRLMVCLLLPLWCCGQGMWMPWNLPDAVYTDLQQRGLRLTVEDLFSTEQPSLKDAIVLFGGGCTGELVSAKGLLFTNHHCARGVLQQLSTLERDLLTDGFWAHRQEEELPCPGLTVTLVVDVRDVTDAVVLAIGPEASEAQRQRRLDSISKVLTAQATRGNHYKAFVRPFYQGNQFYLFVTEEFRDVRLVAAPPQSIGNFGGDTDNWMWPRHTGDFAVFRIYAGADNLPAAFASDNVPYRPRRWFPLSLRGAEAGELTMVYGFPGRTMQYLTSYGVALLDTLINPTRLALRGQRLAIWWQRMLQSDTVKLKYTAKYYGLSNAYKKWQGERYGLRRVDVAHLKRQEEAAFRQRLEQRGGPAGWHNLLGELQRSYDSLQPYQRAMDYWNEALMAPEIWRPATWLKPLVDSTLHHADTAVLNSLRNKAVGQLNDFYRNYDVTTDRMVTSVMVGAYLNGAQARHVPPALQQAMARYRGDAANFARSLFEQSVVDEENRLLEILQHWNEKAAKKLQADPAYQLSTRLTAFYAEYINSGFQKWNDQVNQLNRQYMQALMELFPERRFFPDANLTLRLAYGRVEGYQPRNGVWYRHYTTLDGVLEKYKPGDPEFDVPQRLLDLARNRSYGRYANAYGELPTCFIASNHTTGGNSGSPVINGRGELIGINFDRCWEGTMSDLYFDPAFCRNIAVDIRYVLFLLEHYGGVDYVLSELDLRP